MSEGGSESESESECLGGGERDTHIAMVIPHRLQRIVPVATIAIVLVLLLGGLRPRDSDSSLSHVFCSHSAARKEDAQAPLRPLSPAQRIRHPGVPAGCSPEIDLPRLEDLGLADKILYSRRCVKPMRSAGVDRNEIARFSEPLIATKTEVDLSTGSHVALPACEPLVLRVPQPKPKKQYPQYLFGIATMYDRLATSLPAFEHWMGGTGARLVGVVVDALADDGRSRDFAAIERKYRAAGISLKLFPPRDPGLNVDQNHFTMLREVFESAGPQTEWLALLDDDTFFPSMYNLDEQISQYDPSKPMWLGALSEDFSSVRTWGYMAFGGAGIFLSVPLAREIVPHIQQCLDDAPIITGDTIMRDCVHAHSRAKLTIVPGLQQHDIHGDASGFYEAGRRPVSLHHWKSWYQAPVDRMAAVVNDCGDCFLQRFQFGADTLLANGYSITQYSRGLSEIDLTMMEGTWAEASHEFDWSVGPLRDRLPPHEKRSYRLKDVWRGPKGQLHQVYVYEGDKVTEEMDEVIELIWEG